MNSFLRLSPLSLAVGMGRRGTSIAGVLMLGLAVIRISLIDKGEGGEGEVCRKYVKNVKKRLMLILKPDTELLGYNRLCHQAPPTACN